MKHLLYIVALLMLITSCDDPFQEGKFSFSDLPQEETEVEDPSLELQNKKGVCLTKKDLVWSLKVAALKPYWHYSWGSDITEWDVDSVEFVPMFWGGVKSDDLDKVVEYKEADKVEYVLGFNEPDGEEQANMTVDEALSLWPDLESIDLPLGSPATVNPLNEWMTEFMQRADASGYRIDFVTVHSYGGISADAFLTKLEDTYKAYGRPIWITEFAVADWNASEPSENQYSPAQVLEFMKEVLPELEKREYIHRYSWFSGSITSSALTSSALFDENDNLTELGQYYSAFTANENSGAGQLIPEPEPPVNEDPTNLIVNGDFETGDLTGWSIIANVKTEVTNVINGSYSVRLTGNTSSDRELNQTITVEPGATYKLAFTARIQDGTGASGDNLNDGGGELYAKVRVGDTVLDVATLTSAENSTISGQFTIPDGVTEAVVFFTKNQNIAYIDDVSVNKIVTLGENLVINGDFESQLSDWVIVGDVKPESTNMIEGSYSARMTGNTASNRELKQTIAVESGATYLLSFQGRIHNGAGANGAKVNDNGGELYASIEANGETTNVVTLDAAEDTVMEGEYTVPEGVSEITIIFTKNQNIAYVDLVSLSKKS